MSKKLTIVARIEAKESNIELVKAEALKLIEPTRNEEGYIKYDLYQDNENPNVLVFIETWENKELWQEHVENIPLQNFLKVTDGLLSDLTITQLSKIA
jgi:quinol monooxygenase YgiN